jgi:hypothetical protein
VDKKDKEILIRMALPHINIIRHGFCSDSVESLLHKHEHLDKLTELLDFATATMTKREYERFSKDLEKQYGLSQKHWLAQHCGHPQKKEVKT